VGRSSRDSACAFRAIWCAAAVILSAVLTPGMARAATDGCMSLKVDGGLADLRIASAEYHPADPARHLPAYCEVKGVASPAPDSRIGVVYRLPEGWNGKMLGLGGGGWAGNVTLEAAAEGLGEGYATAQTDTGHPGVDLADMSWVLAPDGAQNTAAMTDFAWRAVHVMTVLGKQVVQRYYAKAAALAYFQGCSTGGRQGLMEVQRFPGDYDAVIAGAPVYDFLVQTTAVVRTQMFHADPPSNLLPAQAILVNRAVLASCDAQDGLADGVIADPMACRWDPAALQCRTGEAPPQCLTTEQVATVRRAYGGLKLANGETIAWPLMRGGEPEWISRSIGDAKAPLGQNALLGFRAVQYFIYADPHRELLTIRPDVLMHDISASKYAPVYEAKDPNITAFAARGGKLLLYHGVDDPGPSPLATIRYFEAARAALSDRHEQVQLFLAPGMYHCRGGPGPDQIKALDALDHWVATSAPPKEVVAFSRRSGAAWPLCAYPGLPHYDGHGDPKASSSFVCRVDASAPSHRP
jgi:feruloyl esterase